MVRLILLLSLISNLAFADNQAILLNQGEKAPYTGDLLPIDTVKSLYNDSLEKSSLQQQLDLTNQNNTILTQEKTLLQNQNSDLVKAANSEKHISDWEKVGYFVLGVAITALAVKGAASLHP